MDTVLANPGIEMGLPIRTVVARSPLKVLVWKLSLVPVWLAIGSFLSWLVQDFGAVSGLGPAGTVSTLILVMFSVSSVLISMLSWNSYRVSIGKASWLTQPKSL